MTYGNLSTTKHFKVNTRTGFSSLIILIENIEIQKLSNGTRAPEFPVIIGTRRASVFATDWYNSHHSNSALAVQYYPPHGFDEDFDSHFVSRDQNRAAFKIKFHEPQVQLLKFE